MTFFFCYLKQKTWSQSRQAQLQLQDLKLAFRKVWEKLDKYMIRTFNQKIHVVTKRIDVNGDFLTDK